MKKLMRYKNILIILFTIIFFLAAITSYLNRVLFPKLIKKIAIEQIEDTLKRKVDIESIHFNWVRGFIIDKVKIYEKGPSDAVFAQAEQVSFGVLFFPGFKHYRITIPFINILSPSAHLRRISEDTWNFSDIFTPAPTAPSAANTQSGKGSPFEIAWGGISISNGKFMVDDISNGHTWSEFFDNINLKLSLSYKGINYDFTADIPKKNGFVGATVYYQPITKNTQAQIHLRNIDTASYLSLVNTADFHLSSGIIKDINLNINYAQDKTSAEGDVLIQNLDITDQDENFKGDIAIRGLDAQYQEGNITARGQMALHHIQTNVPGLSAGGSIQTRIADFELTKEGLTFIGSLHGQDIFLNLKDRQIKTDNVSLDDIKIRKDKEGVQSVGSIMTQGLYVQWPDQRLQGDITLKAVTMRMKNENDISLEGEVQADNFSTSLDDKSLTSQHLRLEDAQLRITEQKNIALNGKLFLNDMTMVLGKNVLTSASLQTDKLFFNLEDGIIKVSTILNAAQGKLLLSDHKIIAADPQLELNLQMPLNTPQKMTYTGSITLSDGHIQGFAPLQSLDNIELDADFQNNEATINALSVNILDTNVRITGTVKNFKDPYLDITADADELNLSKMNDLFPQMVNTLGLSFTGSSFVKVKFEGHAADPLDGNILAVASVKNVTVTSHKLHQEIKNITGIIEATPDYLKWRDFTAVFQGKKYNLMGSLRNFKDPKIMTTLDSPDLHLKADLVKEGQRITINSLKGTCLKANFDSTGSITLHTDRTPTFDIRANASMLLEDLVAELPAPSKISIQPLGPSGLLSIDAELKGNSFNWKADNITATVTSPTIKLMGYTLTDMKIGLDQKDGKINDSTFDGQLYGGIVHAVTSLDLTAPQMPYDLALNIDNTDLHQLKMDSPLRMQEIDGKFYLTSIVHGTVADFKNNMHATGSLAIRDGFLGEFNLFKGLLSILNNALNLGQVMITDVEGNFTIDDQKINTYNLRLKGPSIVLLGKGWVNFDQMCDLNVAVDLSSGVVPAIAQDVLKTLNIRIYDKISNPKFKKKISVPQVINTIFKNLLQ